MQSFRCERLLCSYTTEQSSGSVTIKITENGFVNKAIVVSHSDWVYYVNNTYGKREFLVIRSRIAAPRAEFCCVRSSVIFTSFSQSQKASKFQNTFGVQFLLVVSEQVSRTNFYVHDITNRIKLRTKYFNMRIKKKI